MKTFYPFLIILLIVNLAVAQENTELPFYDDFSNNYENWTTYSSTGDDQWHISGDDGIDFGKCARFYVTSNPPQANDDWLVSKVINTEGASNLAITFKYAYDANGASPDFYFTNSFDGNPANSNWTQIDKSFWKNIGDWQDARIEIENPGETFVFALRYHVSANDTYYFLMDNFKIERFEPNIYTKVDSTEHFEYYTNFPETNDFASEIKEALEKSYQKFDGHYNVPGLEDYIDKQRKTKVYYTNKADVPLNQDDDILTIKSGYFERDSYSLYLCPLDTEDKLDYYGSLEGLAINTFAGYAVSHRIIRDRLQDYLPQYLIEGFGLYEQGYRPNKDSVVSYLNQQEELLSHDVFLSFRNFNNTSEKDILVAHYQYLQLFQGYGFYWYYGQIWNAEIKFYYYFYTAPDDIRIMKYAESDNFDIYCSSRDTMYIDSFKVWLEQTRQFYKDSFQMEINVRYPLLVMYNEQTGMDLSGYDDFNGGSASLNISPHNFWSGLEGYNWLLAHEFGHVFNSLMYIDMPGGFYHEGMANLSGYYMDGGAHRDDRWKIDYVFNYFKDNYNREPTLEEIITNYDAGKPGLEFGIDCYFFGFEFFRYLVKTEGFIKIREFFNNEMDWSVFNNSYEQIDQGYIEYLKYINNEDQNYPELTVNNEIAIERGKSAVITSENLSANDQEATDDRLHFILIKSPTNGHIEKTNNPGVPIDRFSERDIKQGKIIYVNDNNSAISDYFIFNLWDEVLTIGTFQFDITLTTPTAISEFTKEETVPLKIYPNPISNQSVISFQTKCSGNVNLSVFDLQGRKICTLLDEKMNAGTHTIQLGNQLKANGVYLCKLATLEGVSTLKLIVNSKN
jgi:hypothetical protein